MKAKETTHPSKEHRNNHQKFTPILIEGCNNTVQDEKGDIYFKTLSGGLICITGFIK